MSLPDQLNMNATPATAEGAFVDRRVNKDRSGNGQPERRQFGSSHSGLSEQGRELALAIDQYKVRFHRRYLTCDELLNVLRDLGYQQSAK